MRELVELFNALQKSAFRQKFHLRKQELQYIHNKGLDTILRHADDFISQRLAPAFPEKDGKQTPFRGHPIFIAQHATACCCRSCLEKWHSIPRGRPLNTDEKAYLLRVLEYWLLKEQLDH